MVSEKQLWSLNVFFDILNFFLMDSRSRDFLLCFGKKVHTSEIKFAFLNDGSNSERSVIKGIIVSS